MNHTDWRIELRNLRGELERFETELQEAAAQVRHLRLEEAEGRGVHAAEIFRLGQEVLTKRTEIQIRKVRINQILLRTNQEGTT